MDRLLLLFMALAVASGCKANNPAAAFGPPRVAAPKTLQAPPYYPAGSNPGQATPPPPISGRLSVSAEGNPAPLPAGSIGRSDPAEREPIRIVENPGATARTATLPLRDSPPQSTPKSPAASPPAATPSGRSATRKDGAVMPAAYQQAAPTFVEPTPATGQWRAR